MNSIDNDSSSKKVNIIGTNNRYMIKKVTKQEKEIKKRIESNNWDFSKDFFTHDKQLEFLNKIYMSFYNGDINNVDINNVDVNNGDINNVDVNNVDVNEYEIIKIMIHQINKKISGYKQQDLIKKKFEEQQFINFKHIISKMRECELKCRYCKNEMSILYDKVREMKQWSVDRVLNHQGHNMDNYYLACLECNLKKKKQTDEKFLFTKQFQLIKQE
jgi:hypothetical protein